MKHSLSSYFILSLGLWIGTETRLPAEQITTFPKWSCIEIPMEGPPSKGRGNPNPFAIPLNVVVQSPTGKVVTIPGFYDGDGNGGLDGNVWKVRFSADALGLWSWKAKSSEPRLDGKRGQFRVIAIPKDATGFQKWGRLEVVGTAVNEIRYFQFRDGPYWLKAGCDDPENFLGRYRNYDTLAKRKSAIDYLAGHGINSIYVMTHNLGGDDKDVWPWLGKSAREARKNGGRDARFDVAKLEGWRKLFEHCQTQGVVPYLILEDDSAWSGYDHARYYREIIARFGYLPALVFNIGEESNENYKLSKGLELARLLKETDPYDHPRGIHNVNRPTATYVDSPFVDMTAIQTGSPGSRKGLKNALEHNRIAIDWIKTCRSCNKRPLMINFDEGRPEHDRRAWWSAYLGGGVWEAHVLKPYDRPMSTWKTTWNELGGTRAFMESLPFWKMQPRNDLITKGTGLCLAETGKAYAVYLPTGGGVTVKLAPDVTYVSRWWNPANGTSGSFQNQKTVPGGPQTFTAPGKGDWALSIQRKRP